jgi:AraC family transcriptional regulator, transcriptional activator of pobA
MDVTGKEWYFSGMSNLPPIPIFNLFGETLPFPDVVHCERVLDRAGLHDWVISPHRHSQMAQMFYIENGQAKVTLDGVETWLKSGEILYVPPKIVHGFEFVKGTEGMVLSLPSPVVQRLGPASPGLTAWLAAPHQGIVSQTMENLIAELAQSYAKSGTFRTQTLIALAHALLMTLAEQGQSLDETAQDGSRQMQRVDALISEHLTEGWTARDFAAALHITTGHLNRIVRGAAGVNLSSYLETALMTEACRLIVFTRLPVAEVGYRLGFADPSYFSRRFRARMRETPTAYRQRMSG